MPSLLSMPSVRWAYRICLQVVSALLADGLLTEKEAVRVRKGLKKMYEPVVGALTEDDS